MRRAEPGSEVATVSARGLLRAPIPVDAHVHLHDCFDPRRFFDHAAANFDRAAERLGFARQSPGVLVLTEAAGARRFADLRARPRSVEPGEWSLHHTSEALSLIARRRGEDRLILVAGRQLATRERLEVLALSCDRDIPEGLSLDETIVAVHESGAVPLVPWGFGKWWLGRGRLIAGLLERRDLPRVLLADNGCRPALGRRPPLLERAERRGFVVLAGSDPLPLADHVERPGSCGFALETPLAQETPGAGLKAALDRVTSTPRIYAFRRRLGPFVRDQLIMQIEVRRRGAAR